MPRRNRCVLPGVACHITQRGVNRCETFSSQGDYEVYLGLLRENLADSEATILGYCLMGHHVHLVAVPGREESLSVLFRRVHGRYAQYYNARTRRTGHLWQNRFFGCPLGKDHLWAALRYVECNPVRAGMVTEAAEYQWSSAAAHICGTDASGILDMDWWRREAPAGWEQALQASERETDDRLRRCTYAGRPFGNDGFVEELSERFGRYWTRGRPRKQKETAAAGEQRTQLALFS